MWFPIPEAHKELRQTQHLLAVYEEWRDHLRRMAAFTATEGWQTSKEFREEDRRHTALKDKLDEALYKYDQATGGPPPVPLQPDEESAITSNFPPAEAAALSELLSKTLGYLTSRMAWKDPSIARKIIHASAGNGGLFRKLCQSAMIDPRDVMR